MFQNKKGLSDIVTNVLIILLVLVAVGIVWFFIQPFLRDSISGISVDPYTINLGVKARSVSDDGQFVTFKVERGAGKGVLSGFNVIITDLSDTNKVVRNNTILGEFETVTITIDYVALGIGPNQIKYVSVVPIITDSSGNEANGQQSNPEAPYNPTSGPAVCGNSVVELGEQCDTNSGACTTGTGYAGTRTCSASCTWNTCTTTLSCGDGIINGPETCELNGGAGFYGPSCDYGNLHGRGVAQIYGNETCTALTCQISNLCYCFMDVAADPGQEGFVDFADFLEWGTLYDAGNMRADCNHDGVLNSQDGDSSDPVGSPINTCVGRISDLVFNQGIEVCQ